MSLTDRLIMHLTFKTQHRAISLAIKDINSFIVFYKLKIYLFYNKYNKCYYDLLIYITGLTANEK